MIKPDAVENGHIGPILEKITAAGFRIIAMKYTRLSRRDAEVFYAIHKERPFFGELVDFMTRGPIVSAILEKDNAVEDFRALTRQAGLRLTDAELKHLKPLYETARKVIAPLHAEDFGETETASFYNPAQPPKVQF